MCRSGRCGPLLLLPDFRAVLHSRIAPVRTWMRCDHRLSAEHRECGRISLSVISHVISRRASG
jgi:hypothetical protein